DVRRLAARLHGRGLAPRSVARVLSAWRGYFGWRARDEGGASNPVLGVRAPKLGKRLPKALSEPMTMRLFDAAQTGDPEADAEPTLAVRDVAIYELFYSSGLRLSELVG